MQFLDSMKIDNPPQTCFVRKEGFLMRNPGPLQKWKNTYLVITTEGFLHLFNNDQDKEPINTLNLRRSKVLEKKETRFDVVETKKGLIGNKRNTVNLRAKTLGDMSEWIQAITDPF